MLALLDALQIANKSTTLATAWAATWASCWPVSLLAAEIVKLFDSLEPGRKAMAILPNTPHPLHPLPLACFEQAVRRFWESSFPKD